MSFGFLGIQFGFGLQLANMSAIYTKLGADADKIPILWLAGPMTGLLIQPIIGSMSDRTWNWLGRRRPYFLTGAILSSIALFFMPDAPALWVAATMLWVLDASINVSMEPFRAFVADKLPADQRTAGFVMQSFFIGIGAAVANALPAILGHFGVTGNAPNGVPIAVLYAFKLGAVVFLLAVLWTVFTSKEYPPEDMEAFRRKKSEHKTISHRAEVPWPSARLPERSWECPAAHWWITISPSGMCWPGCRRRSDRHRAQRAGSRRGAPGDAADDEAAGGCAVLYLDGPFLHVDVFQPRDGAAGIWHRWIQSAAFDQGTAFGGQTFAWYSIVCFLVAFILPPLAKATNRRVVHSLALMCGGRQPAGHRLHPRPHSLAMHDDRRRNRLGVDPLDALRHAFRRAARRAHGRLHGHL